MTDITGAALRAAQPGLGGFTESAAKTTETRRGLFGANLIGALEYVNEKQLRESEVAQQLLIDPDSVDIHDVTTAMAEAGMSLEAANRIINQMISSWNEVTSTR